MSTLIKEHILEPSIEKLRRSVRPDIFDENHVLKNYPLVQTPKRTRLTIADLKIEMVMADSRSERRPSIDLVQAAQAARKDIWKLHERPGTSINREPSRERPKSAVDLIEAANKSRKARGERPLPVEPVRTDIRDPYKVQQTSLGSPTRYAPPGGNSARANAASESLVRHASTNSESQGHRRRSHSLDHGRPFVEEQPRPSTSGKSSRYPAHRRTLTPVTHDPMPADAESIAELAMKFPPAPKSPKSMSRRSSSRKSRFSTDSGTLYGSRITSPISPPANDIHIMEVVNSNGELHERYRSNSEDVEHMSTQFAKAVIHETITPKVHNVVTTEINRHHHTHEVRHHIQPVVEKVYGPEKHWIQLEDGTFQQVTAEEAEKYKAKYRWSAVVEEPVASERISREAHNQGWKRRKEPRYDDESSSDYY